MMCCMSFGFGDSCANGVMQTRICATTLRIDLLSPGTKNCNRHWANKAAAAAIRSWLRPSLLLKPAFAGVGVVLGAIIAFILTAGAIVFFRMRRERERSAIVTPHGGTKSNLYDNDAVPPTSELEARSRPIELSNGFR